MLKKFKKNAFRIKKLKKVLQRILAYANIVASKKGAR